MSTSLANQIARLQGPILVLGASGFVGANLLKMLLAHRTDVVGTSSSLPAWRLQGVPEASVRAVDLLVDTNLDALLESVKPRTVFNCVAYGGYSFQVDSELIFKTNFNLTAKLVERLQSRNIAAYIHAGSSSEYGELAAGPAEDTLPLPNSDYAVSKVACANLLSYYGRAKRFPCVNLRLYSVYGPLEDSSRLVPSLIRAGSEGKLPDFVCPDISRDFVYIEDTCQAFVLAALHLQEEHYGKSFNVGTGRKTTIGEVAEIARRQFGIAEPPVFTMPNRNWDVSDWYANVERTTHQLEWQASTVFEDGLKATAAWYDSLEDKEKYYRSSKRFGLDTKFSVSAVLACSSEGRATAALYQRLKAVFEKLRIEYEIIFVSDSNSAESEEIIRAISRNDRRVIGVSHSRRFGSQAAFRSGMELSTKNACVLLCDDLRDPPELIEQFVAKWREGYEVVYGRPISRAEPAWSRWGYKLFHRLFDWFSYLKIPHEAGDFSLMDRCVVQAVLRFPERDLFLRAVRAYAGFKQIGVEYAQAASLVDAQGGHFLQKVGRAKKGILSYSNVPLNVLSLFGTLLLLLSLALGAVQIAVRLLLPERSASGITTVILTVLFFGAVNLFAVGMLGEYVARIFEEVKLRPHFIRRAYIRDGEIRLAAERERELRS